MSTKPEPSRADRLDDLAQDALLEIMETGTISQKILVLPLLVPRPLPQQRKPDPGAAFGAVYIVQELDDNGDPITRELDTAEIERVKPGKHRPGADGVVSYP